MYRAAFLVAALLAAPLHASPLNGTFPSIDGGTLSIEDWRGRPVLVVNTASLCGFTPQYDDLQALHERYVDKGLVVLAVPSNDFRQELATGEEVQEFCEMNFGLTLPMTDITAVKGRDAHPFYAALRDEGFVPRWNFNKVLIGPDGALVETWGSATAPDDRRITDRIDALLN
ncbi:MAG: glutathione peroxidase [Pseudomonadota bacterium]